MKKRILITGATDGIGFETAKLLNEQGHDLIVHGRNASKLEKVMTLLKTQNNQVDVDGFVADFSSMKEVKVMAEEVLKKYDHLDGLINNAGVFAARDTETSEGLELRFAVNTYAPYLLTNMLRPIMDGNSRVVNLSSAAQGTVELDALESFKPISHDAAYAESKLAITMWSVALAKKYEKTNGPLVVAVNPKSFLGSKMVKEAYGTAGHDLRIGADILWRAVLSDEFSDANGKYFDNDYGKFANPHPDALNAEKRQAVVDVLDSVLSKF